MPITIAVVDDEHDILHLVSIHLRKAGFDVAGFSDGVSFSRYLHSGKKPGLIILDLMLPDINGMEICKELKNDEKYKNIPVIMLTAKTQESERVAGLDLGADDYVTKPFSPKELIARVKAVLRRSGISVPPFIEVENLITIDEERFEVKVKGQAVPLTVVEFRILAFLASNRGKVFSRERILNHLWGNNKAVIDRTIDVHIKNLREKLGEASYLIQNIRGVGYKMEG